MIQVKGQFPCYVDVDGTLTEKQEKNSYLGKLRQDVIDKVNRLIDEGKEVIIWSGSTEYAKAACDYLHIKPACIIGKPQLIVDNLCKETRWIKKQFLSRLILPEDFVKKDL